MTQQLNLPFGPPPPFDKPFRARLVPPREPFAIRGDGYVVTMRQVMPPSEPPSDGDLGLFKALWSWMFKVVAQVVWGSLNLLRQPFVPDGLQRGTRGS